MPDALPGWLAGWLAATPNVVPMVLVFGIALLGVGVAAHCISALTKEDNDG